eukprot:3233010-Pyramimonas_sp.AAC.1
MTSAILPVLSPPRPRARLQQLAAGRAAPRGSRGGPSEINDGALGRLRQRGCSGGQGCSGGLQQSPRRDSFRKRPSAFTPIGRSRRKLDYE